MTVITTDILLEGIRRDSVFDWLGEPAHHQALLNGALRDLRKLDDQSYEGKVPSKPVDRPLRYVFDRKDDSHGGRRILCRTEGRRLAGSLNYSLRTMKPSTNTLLTIHLDYQPGRLLGAVLDSTILRRELETVLKRIAQNASAAIPRD
ncbi:MAG: hypothetical protein GXP62_03005 [Oligoflexia bacterium]|nr:hypothetical protein [Oligoflexia bacterium]